MNGEFYDREYNTRVGVSDVDGYFQRWAETSAAVRATLSADLDLHYGNAARETLDFFPAENSITTLVFIHGGYWRMMDKNSFSFIAPPFVKTGMNVAIIDYDLCPFVTIGVIIEQCRRALGWLHQNYREQTQRIIISGHSAGGHLTAMMFATEWVNYDLPAEAIVGGTAISGLFDLEPLRHTAMNSDLCLDETSARLWSPVSNKPTVQAPLRLIVGTQESSEFHRQSRILSEAWPNCAPPDILENYHHFNILEAFMETPYLP